MSALVPSAKLDVSPQIIDIAAYQDDTFLLELTVNKPDGTPADLTGAAVRMEVREAIADNDTVIAATATPTVIDGPNGRVDLKITAASMLNLRGAYVYDVQVESTLLMKQRTTAVRGLFSVAGDVTRPST